MGNDKFVFDTTAPNTQYGRIRDYTNTANEKDVIVLQISAEHKAILDADTTMTDEERFALIGLDVTVDDNGLIFTAIGSFTSRILISERGDGFLPLSDVVFEFVAVEETPIPEIVLVEENTDGDGGFARFLTDINRNPDDFDISISNIITGGKLDASAFEFREVGGIYQLWIAEGVRLNADTHGAIVLDLEFTDKADTTTSERITIHVQEAITAPEDTTLPTDDIFVLDYQAEAEDADIIEDFGNGNDRLRLNYRGRNSEFTILASSSIIALQSLFNIRWVQADASLEGHHARRRRPPCQKHHHLQHQRHPHRGR